MRNLVQVSWIFGFVVLSGCANLTTCPSTAPGRSSTSQDQPAIPNEKDQATIRALHKQLQERDQGILYRDQQIELLSSQLDALKRIDQENHRRAVRPPVILPP